MARRFITVMIIIAATLLQFISVYGAIDRHNSATEVPGSRIGLYHRGKVDSDESGQQDPALRPNVGLFLHDRRLAARVRFEADSVEVDDYTPPCANTKHDPSVCKPN